MPDPELTPNNCDGETCSVILGTDPLSLNTNQRLAVVKRDERTIECFDGEDNPGEPGLRVKRCAAAADIPYDARPIPQVTGDPDTQTYANSLRVRDGATPETADCGLLVMAPMIASHPQGVRVAIPVTQDAASADSVTIDLVNPDDIPLLFTVAGMANIIVGFGGGAGNRMFLGDIQTYLTPNGSEFISATGSTGTTPPNAPPGAGNLRQRLTLLEHSAGAPTAPYMASAHEVRDEFLVPPNTTWVWHARCRNVQDDNVVLSGGDFGFVMEGITVRREQAWRMTL